MTGIACIVGKDKTVMAGDSAASCVDYHSVHLTATPKVFKKDFCLIGYTSSFRMGYLIEHKLELPPLRDNLDYWANIDFIDSLRTTLKEGGWLKKDNERECSGSFLLAVKDQIFQIAGDLQANRHLNNFAAVGSGESAILGSLFSTKTSNMTTRERALLSLAAAAHCNITVRAPFHLVELNHED